MCGCYLVPACAAVASDVVCGVVVGGGWICVLSSWYVCGFYVGGGVCCVSSALRCKSKLKSKCVKSERSKLQQDKGTCVHNRAWSDSLYDISDLVTVRIVILLLII